jgi:hypothetical protein
VAQDGRRRSKKKNDEDTITFEFPIIYLGGTIKMNNIPPSSQRNFHGLDSEDFDAFLFDFEVLCRNYYYSTTSKKLKLFPSTLKGAAL